MSRRHWDRNAPPVSAEQVRTYKIANLAAFYELLDRRRAQGRDVSDLEADIRGLRLDLQNFKIKPPTDAELEAARAKVRAERERRIREDAAEEENGNG